MEKKKPSIKPKRRALSKAERKQVYEKYNGHCAYCGCELKMQNMQADHIVSVYWNNGTNSIENYNPSCRMCNFYKSTLSIEEFRNKLQTVTERLEKTFIYRLAKKYGIVKEDKKKIIFYFEQFENVKPAVKDAAQDATQQCLKSAT